MKRSGLLVLLLYPVIFMQSQTLGTGVGLYMSDQETFKQGKKINFDVGHRITEWFMPCFSYSFGRSPTSTKVYPRIIRYEYDGWSAGKPIDTLYNVKETNKYEFRSYLLKFRFFILAENSQRVKFYFAPVIGCTDMIEKMNWEHPDENFSRTHQVLSTTWGCNLGIEYALNKKQSMLLDLQFEPLVIRSENRIMDGYFPPFSQRDTGIASFNVNLRWEFCKEYHK